MFKSYAPNVNATIAFLKLLNVKVNKATVDETLQSHPDWPSLLCISDSLQKWNIPNAAARIDKNDMEQLPVPFIAYTTEQEYPLAIVTEVGNGFVKYMAKGYMQNGIKISYEDFGKIWDGIYLIAEPTMDSGEKDFAVIRKQELIKQVIPFTLLAGTLLFLFYTVSKAANAAQLKGWVIYIQFVLLIVGVAISSLLLKYEVDKNNVALKKVCTGIVKGNCDAILSGKLSKLFSWLSWSEVGFFYFTGSLLNLVFASTNLPVTIVILNWLSLLALPYTVFSIYYQWQVAKQWCILCLAVQLILIAGASHAIIFYQLQSPFAIASIFQFLPIVFFFLLPALLWYVIKPYLLKLQTAKTQKRQHLRLKFNLQVFDSLLKIQKQITEPTDGLGIVLGNPAAEHELVKVCNPYCGPCAKAHPEIEKLLGENNNIKARIIFTATNDENDWVSKPVKHLLAIAEINSREQLVKALDDWYLAPKKDYDVFAAKYPMNGELKRQEEKVDAMGKWCTAMDIKATPTIFINGYEFPNVYSIWDINYFLST